MGYVPMWGENLPEDFIYRERLPQRRGNCCTPIQTFRPRETGQERGGEEEKLPFSCSFPPNPPCSFQEWPLSLNKIQEETSGHAAEMIWEKYLYRVLILWLFLQFLNFKWEYWNTDIDMKRFIVTIYHYYHRPYCYYRWFQPSVAEILCSQCVFWLDSEDNRVGYIYKYICICIWRYFWIERCILFRARHP